MQNLIGALVPCPPWTAKIVGVFDVAVSMLHPDGSLVSLVGSETRMEARAFCHPRNFFDYRDKARKHFDGPQEKELLAAYSGGCLALLHAGEEGINLSALDLTDAMAWGIRHRGRREELIDSAAVNSAALAIRQTVDQAHRAGRPLEGIHAEGIFSKTFRRLKLAPDFPVNLVGFGPGTTPAGDDWLAGYLAALDLRGGVCTRPAAELRSRLPGRLERTSAAGRALLLGAIEGIPPAYLADLSRAALSAQTFPESLEKAVSAALLHGATSGEDAIAGFLAGLQKRRK